MKVGLVTVYNGYNYGSKLQAYAIQSVLKNKIRVDVEIIDYNRAKDLRLSTIIRKVVRKIERQLEGDTKKAKKTYPDMVLARRKTFDGFDKNYNLTSEIRGYSNLQKIVDNYDVFICGSDQIWSPDLIVTDFYTLYFVGGKKKTISYAASFGIDKIPNKKIKAYQKFLNRINIISVRENSGKKLVNELTGKNSTWVLDPTLLLCRDEWKQLIQNSSVGNYANKKYILCYFLGTIQAHRNFAETLRKFKGYDVICFPYMRGYNEVDKNIVGDKLYDINPLQFVYLISNAEYVCTDSFHGTVFSIIFNKQFFSLRRYSDVDTHSTNTRIVSLLEMLGLGNRLINPDTDVRQIRDITTTEYSVVNDKLNTERQKSLEFLEQAINEENY